MVIIMVQQQKGKQDQKKQMVQQQQQMKPIDQLTTNRIPLIIPHCSSSAVYESKEEERMLEKELTEAMEQHTKMMNLFLELQRIEYGEAVRMKKWVRRSPKEILQKFICMEHNCGKQYSTNTSLARHARLKHTCMKVKPPQPYYQLHPTLNLIEQNDESDTKQLPKDST